MRRARRAAARIGAPAADFRSAARRVPVRRRRLEQRRRDDGRRLRRAGQHLLDRVRRSRASTSRLTRARSPRGTARGTSSIASRATISISIDTLARLYDEPYADSSAIPTYRVCQLARKHVTVALSGDGGDESFGGYRRYRLHLAEERLRSALSLSIRRPLFGLLGRAYPKADWAPRPLSREIDVRGARQGIRSKRTFTAFRSSATTCVGELFSNELRARLGGYNAIEVFRRHAANAGTDDPLALIQYLDLKTYLVGDINTKVDRASMAHSLEVREPLMDHPLVEWLATLPSSLKVRSQEGKWLLKKAMEPHLPHDVIYRPKMGFAVPLARWFRGPLRQRVRDAVLGDRLASTGFFNRDYLSPVGRASPIGTARLQLVAVDAADVRRIPAQCRRRLDRRANRRQSSMIGMRILHILDHSLPLHSGYTFRTAAILREQRRLGWETLQLTTPRHGRVSQGVDDAEGWHFHRTVFRPNALSRVPGVIYVQEMAATGRRIMELVKEFEPDILQAHSPVLNALPALWARRQCRHSGRLRGSRAVGGRGRRPRHDARRQPALWHVARARNVRAAPGRSRHDNLRRTARGNRGTRHSPGSNHRHSQRGRRHAIPHRCAAGSEAASRGWDWMA